MKKEKQLKYEREFKQQHGSSKVNKDNREIVDVTYEPKVEQVTKLERIELLKTIKRDALLQVERATEIAKSAEIELALYK